MSLSFTTMTTAMSPITTATTTTTTSITSPPPTTPITYTTLHLPPSTPWHNKPAIIVPLFSIVLITICLIGHYLIAKFTSWGWLYDGGSVGAARLRGGRNQRMAMRLRGIDAAEQGRRDRLVGERERAREREVGREWIGGYSGMVVARREMDVLPRYEEREGGVVGSGSGNGGVTVAVTMPPPAYEGFGRGGQGYEGRRYFGGI